MAKLYVIAIETGPVNGFPLGQGFPDNDGTMISWKPDEHATESEAFARARTLRDKGYRISMRDPKGRIWTHDEIFEKADVKMI